MHLKLLEQDACRRRPRRPEPFSRPAARGLTFVVLVLALTFDCAHAATRQFGRILALGDSITQAYFLLGTNGGYSWRYPLWKQMIDAQDSFTMVGSLTNNWGGNTAYPVYETTNVFDRHHEGHFGWKASEILNGMEVLPDEWRTGTGTGKLSDWLTQYTPDTAIMLIGINDLMLEVNSANIPGELVVVSNRQAAIISQLQADNPAVRIYLCKLTPTTVNSSPPTGTPVAGSTIVPLFNAIVPDIAAAATTLYSRVTVVDLATNFPTAHLYDGLHPNANGETNIAARIFAAMHVSDSAPFSISQSMTADRTGLVLSFPVTAYRACQVQSRDSLTSGDWSVVTNIPAATVARVLQVTNLLNAATARCFRIRQTP